MSGKFRDKETGVEGYLRANREIEYQIEDERGVVINGSFKTLSELLEKWEEIDEEPKEFWHILPNGGVIIKIDNGNALRREFIEDCKEIGNYFETKEEAEKAVEKLRAWKRLRDKGIKFKKEEFYGGYEYSISACYDDDYADDLDLLFGGEE